MSDYTPNIGAQKPVVSDSVAALRTATGGNADKLDAHVVKRGVCVISGAETRSNASYGFMPTPDVVTGVVVPANAVLCVSYRATWKSATASRGRAAIFIGANQVKISNEATTDPGLTNAQTEPTDNFWSLLCSGNGGLSRMGTAGANQYGSDVTTGQLLGFKPSTDPPVSGVSRIFVAAGTYDVGIKFYSLVADALTVKDRKLWVWVETF